VADPTALQGAFGTSRQVDRSVRCQRIASRDAPGRFCATDDEAVFCDGRSPVGGAARLEAAVHATAQVWRDVGSVLVDGAEGCARAEAAAGWDSEVVSDECEGQGDRDEERGPLAVRQHRAPPPLANLSRGYTPSPGFATLSQQEPAGRGGTVAAPPREEAVGSSSNASRSATGAGAGRPQTSVVASRPHSTFSIHHSTWSSSLHPKARPSLRA
jgi:hypothetical protein